jgi:hypothetical protein
MRRRVNAVGKAYIQLVKGILRSTGNTQRRLYIAKQYGQHVKACVAKRKQIIKALNK